MPLVEDSLKQLEAVTGALPAGEHRQGQADMAAAVAEAISAQRHLVVQAGTGTGKSLAYLVPAILSRKTVVVATATKALQEQLCGQDLPFLSEQLRGVLPFSFRYALLKGRSNYLCVQRAAEVEAASKSAQLAFDELAERAPARELEALLEWSSGTSTGDRAELPFEPTPPAWSALSVSALECPGATRCPRGDECFAEAARDRAAAADIVVVNTHLYGLHLASSGALLPPHDVVIFDEAHQLEDVISGTAGIEVSPGRLSNLARTTRSILAGGEIPAALEDAAGLLAAALARQAGRRIRRMTEDEIHDALTTSRRRTERVISALRAVPDTGPGDVAARKARATAAATHLIEDLDSLIGFSGPDVVWVEGPTDRPSLRLAPIDVGEMLTETLWSQTTAVLTSATIPPRLPERVGLEEGTFEALDVGSPFDYESNALLYCAAHLPDPRSERFSEEMHQELAELIRAAGGRTLALFTSWRAMDAAADALAESLPGPLLTQRDLPKPALLSTFREDERTSLFATMGFWQGVDVPGATLSLVAIDRIPFPRPDEPLQQARREQARERAFQLIDLPRAATLLAQGAGRLVRSSTDRGVVAVLDPRLATAGYRWELVWALPPMRRTRDREEALGFLRSLSGAERSA